MNYFIKHIITALFVLLGFSLNAQTVQYFNKVYSLSDTDTLNTVFSKTIFFNNNYIVTGSEIDQNGLIEYAYFFDSLGVLQNKIVLDNSDNLNTIYTENDLILNSENHFLSIFSYALDTTSNGYLNYDIRLIKFTDEGEILWFNSYGGTDGESPFQIIETSDGGYLITGFSRDVLADDWFRFYALKLDKEGNEQWQKNFGEPHWHAKSFSVIETQSGKFLISGWVILEGLLQEQMFVKLDNEGNLIWQRIFGNEYSDCASTLVALNDSVIWQFGCVRDANNFYFQSAHINEELEVYKDTTYLLPFENGYTLAYSFPQILPSGAAVTTSIFYNENNKWQPSILKINKDLEIEWLNIYSLNDNESCLLRGLDVTPDGGFILAGMQWTGNKDGWLLKVDSLGNTCSYLDCDSISTIPLTENDILATIELENQFPDTVSYSDPIIKIVKDSIDMSNGILSNSENHFLNLYPNPAKNRLSINYRLPPYAGDQTLLVFYNTEGKMVRVENLSAYSNEYLINLHHWAKGVYLYKVHLYDQILFEGKLVVE